PRGPARPAAQLGAGGGATARFSWMVRNPDNGLSRALAKPGHELQHGPATEEPTPEQLEGAEAALAACLELEHGAAGTKEQAAVARGLRARRREDAGGLLHRRALQSR